MRPPVAVSRPVSISSMIQSSMPFPLRVDSTRAGAQIDGEVGALMAVVDEEPLDVVALVAEGDGELAEPVERVVLHDVPQDRPSTDLDHRLGPDLGLFGQSRAQPTGQNATFTVPSHASRHPN